MQGFPNRGAHTRSGCLVKAKATRINVMSWRTSTQAQAVNIRPKAEPSDQLVLEILNQHNNTQQQYTLPPKHHQDKTTPKALRHRLHTTAAALHM